MDDQTMGHDPAAQAQTLIMRQDVSERARTMLKRLLAAHEVWFDVERDRTVAGRVFPGVAEYHEQGERYVLTKSCLLYTSPSPRDTKLSRMPSSA